MEAIGGKEILATEQLHGEPIRLPAWAERMRQVDDPESDLGTVIEERMRLAVRALFASMELLRAWVDRGPQ